MLAPAGAGVRPGRPGPGALAGFTFVAGPVLVALLARARREVSLEAESANVTGLAARGPTAEQSVLAEEERRAVRQALASLPPVDRLILQRCLVEGESGQDLAARLGIRRDALYQRLRRAKIRLRAILEERGKIEPGTAV